jgi:hypothetical protein
MRTLCRFAISALAVLLVTATVVVFLTVANLTAATKPPEPSWPSQGPGCHPRRQSKACTQARQSSKPHAGDGAEECQPPYRRQRTKPAKPLQLSQEHRSKPRRDPI